MHCHLNVILVAEITTQNFRIYSRVNLQKYLCFSRNESYISDTDIIFPIFQTIVSSFRILTFSEFLAQVIDTDR